MKKKKNQIKYPVFCVYIQKFVFVMKGKELNFSSCEFVVFIFKEIHPL